MSLLIVLVITIFCLFLALIVYLRNPRVKINRLFFFLVLFVVFWILSNFFENEFKDIGIASFLLRVDFALGTIVGYFFFLFCRNFPGYKKILSKKVNYFLYITAITLFFLSLFTDFIINNISFSNIGAIIFDFGPLFFVYALYLSLTILSGIISLIIIYRSSRGIRRNQVLYVILGLSITAILVLLFSLILQNIVTVEVFRIQLYGFIFFISFTTYAIVKHRLLDIRIVITRSIIYFFLVLFVASVFTGVTFLAGILFENVLGVNAFLVTLAVSLIIVLLLDPIKHWLSRATDEVFFKAKIEYPEVSLQLSAIISEEIEIDNLVERLTKKLNQGMKIDRSVLVLADKKGIFKVRTEEHPHTEPIVLKQDNPLIEYLKGEDRIIITEELQRKIEDTTDNEKRKSLEKSMEALEQIKAAAVAPVKTKNRLNAVLVLGPKLSGDIFNREELDLVNVLSPQVASAIEKSKLYEEVKGFSQTLQYRVDEATQELSERNKFLLALQRVTNLITRSLDFKKVTQNIVNSIQKELGYIGGLLIFLNKEKGLLYPEAVTESGITKKAMKLLPKSMTEYTSILSEDNTLDAKAVKEQKIKIGKGMEEFISPPVPKAVCLAMNKLLRVKSIVAVPIFSENEVIGVIDIALKKPKEEISEKEIKMMKSLADQTGIVARNLRLFEQIQKANKDLEEANFHLRQLDQAKSEFVSIASHQLRTPMTGIMGYLSMLTSGDFGKVKPEHNKLLLKLLDESERMIRLINQFLNVTKIESGKFELERKKVVIEDLIKEKVNEVENIAKEKKLKLVYQKPAKKLPVFMGDPDKLSDVILNLIDNAIKYSRKGTITIRAFKKVNDLVVTIEDTGVGIKPEDTKELFGKFSRGTGIARIQPDGSGLGLFIAKSVVEGHGGKIWVESRGEGKGAKFVFTIPLKR